MVGDLGPQCPPSHVRGADWDSTQASESCLLAQCSSQSQRIYCWWPVTGIFMTTLGPRDRVSRDCHAGVSCHYSVTSSSLGQRSCHYPDKITQIGILMVHQMKVQCGKLFFRIDSMCNSVKCDTPCFMEWCHATNLSNSPVCSMSRTLG